MTMDSYCLLFCNFEKSFVAKMNATMFLGKDTMLLLKVTMTMYSYCLLFCNFEKTFVAKVNDTMFLRKDTML